MNSMKTVLACVLGCVLHATASAQIYESKDAEGVTEFSDTPTTDSEVVELQPTNTADPVEEAAPDMAPAQQQMPAGAGNEGVVRGGEDEGEPGYIYYGNDDDEPGPREQRREDAARVENRLPGEAGGPLREGPAGDEAGAHHEAGHAVHGAPAHR